ncbi:hypothetical protein [Streptomyces cinnamoneus]|nr:hypothetical protein [Streptomyces cinnamoneus]
MARSSTRNGVTAATITAFALLVGLATSSAAQPGPSQATPRAATAPAPDGDDDMPFAVEKFEYPDSAKILKEKGITLQRGDGHIVLADCAVSNDIEIRTRVGQKNYCFEVKSRPGDLTLQIPQAFSIAVKDFQVAATIKVDGAESNINVKNGLATFGEAGTPPTGRADLIRLKVAG